MPFPKFEDWQAPWEKSGTDFDAEKAKGLIYSLHKEAAEVKERHDVALTAVTEERDTLKAKVDEHETKDLSEVERLKRENEKLKANPPKPDSGQSLEVARLELALEHGLTKAQARRLAGSTVEELTADAAEYAKELGIEGEKPSNGSGGSKAPPPSRKPDAKNLRSGLDGGRDAENYTPEQALADLPPRR